MTRSHTVLHVNVKSLIKSNACRFSREAGSEIIETNKQTKKSNNFNDDSNAFYRQAGGGPLESWLN